MANAAAEAARQKQVTTAPTGQLRILNAASVASAGATGIASSVVTVRASAGVHAGIGTQVAVRFNGVLVAAGELTHTEAVDYALELRGGAAGGMLDIAVTNASSSDGAALRSLRIEQLNVNGATVKPGDPVVEFDAGAGELAFDGQGTSLATPLITRDGAMRFSLPATAPDAGTTSPGYYIDAQRGDDRNPGSAASPWRTLAKVQVANPSRSPAVFLRCDSVWREAVKLDARLLLDGAEVSGYGPECAARKAMITGADAFSGGWQKSGTLWVRSLPQGTAKITQLLVDGQPLRTAQWPNTGAHQSRSATLIPNGASDRTMILGESEASSVQQQDLAQATVQIRTQAWLVETRRVLALNSSQLQLDRTTNWPANGGKPYVLQDKLWMLDAAGEFFHDVTAQRLYLIPPQSQTAADLNGLTIEGTVRDTVLTIEGVPRVKLHHLALIAGGQTGLMLLDTEAADIDRVEASYNLAYGLRVVQPDTTSSTTGYVNVSTSVFRGNGMYGIDAAYSRGTRLISNVVADTGNSSQHQGGVVAGIANGPDGITEGNVVENSGYIGIHFSSRGSSRVVGNAVNHFCRRLTDCGGIYTWTERSDAASTGAAVVQGNRVLASDVSTPAGSKSFGETVVGIYIDDNSHGVTVHDNLLTHVPMGVFVHNASRVTVSNNRIWFPALVGLWASMDDAESDALTGNVFRNNEIVPALHVDALPNQLPRFTSAQAVWFWHTRAGQSGLAPSRNLFTGNVVIQLHGHMQDHAWLRGPQGDERVNELEWLSLNGAEPAVRRPARFDAVLPVLGPELVVNSQFEQGTQNWIEYRNPTTAGGRTQWTPTQAGCSGACVAFTAADRGDLLGSQAFSMRAGVPHLYRWSATMSAHTPGTVGLPYISRDTTPWDMMTDAQGFKSISSRSAAAGETLKYEAYFLPKETTPSRVNLQLDTLHAPVSFDAVSVREVLGYEVARQKMSMAVVMAQRDSDHVFSCRDLDWPDTCAATDVTGKTVSFPLTVTAGTERLLLRTDTPFRR